MENHVEFPSHTKVLNTKDVPLKAIMEFLGVTLQMDMEIVQNLVILVPVILRQVRNFKNV